MVSCATMAQEPLIHGAWLTPNERGRGATLVDGGAPLGTAFGAIIIAGLITWFDSWRIAFIIAGVGTVAAGIWAWWYIRNHPSEHPQVNAAELAYITQANDAATQANGNRKAVLKELLKSRSVLCMFAGYACYNDGSIRDWQIATSQWTPGKNFYRTGGFGPWMVTSDEIAPAQVMRLQTVLNGQVLQDTTTDKMIHSIPRQIAYISTFIPLSPGDVIVTGTPGGVGNKRTPQIFMKPGDVCEIVVDAIGTLRNGIRDDA